MTNEERQALIMTTEEMQRQIKEIDIICKKYQDGEGEMNEEEEKKIKRFAEEYTKHVADLYTTTMDSLNKLGIWWKKQESEYNAFCDYVDWMQEKMKSILPENSNLTKEILETEKRIYVIREYNDGDFGYKEVYTTLRGAKLIATKLYGHLDTFVVIWDKEEGVVVDDRIYGEERGGKWSRVFYTGESHVL